MTDVITCAYCRAKWRVENESAGLTIKVTGVCPACSVSTRCAVCFGFGGLIEEAGCKLCNGNGAIIAWVTARNRWFTATDSGPKGLKPPKETLFEVASHRPIKHYWITCPECVNQGPRCRHCDGQGAVIRPWGLRRVYSTQKSKGAS